jgi:hypothetical protein
LNGAIGSWVVNPSVGCGTVDTRARRGPRPVADALSLAAPRQVFSAGQGDVGLRFGRAMGRLRPELSSIYRRGWGERQTRATLDVSGIPDGRFVVNGSFLPRDTIVGRAGVTLRTESVGLNLVYEIERAERLLRQSLQFSFGFE